MLDYGECYGEKRDQSLGAEVNLTVLDEDREPSLKRIRGQTFQGGDRVSHVGIVIRNIQMEVSMCRAPETTSKALRMEHVWRVKMWDMTLNIRI